jgi:predicted lactoylglutathione lyase
MTKMIFVNLPVTDVVRSRQFYQSLGYSINEQFSDETAACVVVSDSIYFMILNHERFAGFAPRPMADTSKTTSVLLALSCENREAVDAFAAAALANGGSEPAEARDMGFMYNRVISDPDGNTFEPFWMDMTATAP